MSLSIQPEGHGARPSQMLVAWLSVDEGLPVGNGSDDVVVDEVIDESMGPPVVIPCYCDAGGS